MARIASAGLLLFRRTNGEPEFFLAHPGGPFWKHKDDGAWTIPKGLIDDGEAPLDAACREFEEETGIHPQGPYLPLGKVQQKSGKVVHAWAFEGDADPAQVHSNLVAGARGKTGQSFPEIDRCEWFSAEQARHKLNPAQVEFIDKLKELIDEALKD